MPRPPCGRGGCTRDRMKGKQACEWHWVLNQPVDVQEARSRKRLEASTGDYRARVAPEDWPEGERWCAGCQSFVPLFYTTGSRCKACASAAAHESRVQSTYGLGPGEYAKLLEWQGGSCYICQRKPGKKRLAVDHDHKTGAVRGLLCANNEHGCNRGVVANLEAAVDSGLAAARRAVTYLETPPYWRMRNGEASPAARPVSSLPEIRLYQPGTCCVNVGKPACVCEPPPF